MAHCTSSSTSKWTSASTMKAAHDQVTALENEIRSEVPEIAAILTHIESEPATIEPGEQIIQDAALERRLRAIAGNSEVIDAHEFRFKRVRGRLYVSCHITIRDDMPLARVQRRPDSSRNPLQTRRSENSFAS